MFYNIFYFKFFKFYMHYTKYKFFINKNIVITSNKINENLITFYSLY
jgi:hypothetical protein